MKFYEIEYTFKITTRAEDDDQAFVQADTKFAKVLDYCTPQDFECFVTKEIEIEN